MSVQERNQRPTSTLRLLLWLKIALTWRTFRSSKAKIWNLVALLACLLPISVLAAFGIWYLFAAAPDVANLITRDGLALVFLLWVLAPLIGFQLNESYDLTKLFVYPVSYRQIFLGSFLGNLLDTTVLLTVPPLTVIVIQFSKGPGSAILAILTALLFMLATIALSQAITLALVGFLRSRRFRDITIVLFPLIGMAYYIGQQTLLRHVFHESREKVIRSPIWNAASWMPPGYAANAFSAIGSGNWLAGIMWIVIQIAWIAVVVAIASTILKKLYMGDAGHLPAARAPQRSKVETKTQAPSRVPGWLPQEIAAVVGKELTYLVRDPQYKALAVQLLYSMLALAVPLLLPSSQMSTGLPWGSLGNFALLGVDSALLLAVAPLIFNIFGGEGAAITVLFSLPTSRRSILIGKNISHFLVLMVLAVIGLGVVCSFTHLWGGLPIALLTIILAAPVLLAGGNLISVRLPHRMMVRGQRWQRGGASTGDTNMGCLYGLAYAAAYAVTVITLLPVGIAAILPELINAQSWLYLITLPLAALYSIALYVLLLGTAETWLRNREPEIAARVMPPD